MNVRQVFGEASPAITSRLDEIVKSLGLGDGDMFVDFDTESGIMKFLDAVLAGLQHNARGMTASATGVDRTKFIIESFTQWSSDDGARKLSSPAGFVDQCLRERGMSLLSAAEIAQLEAGNR